MLQVHNNLHCYMGQWSFIKDIGSRRIKNKEEIMYFSVEYLKYFLFNDLIQI